MPMWVGIEETDRWRDCWGQVGPWRGGGFEVRAIGSDLSLRSHITSSLPHGLPHNTHPPQKGLRWPHCCTGSETGLKHTAGLLLIPPYAQSTRLAVDSVTKVLSLHTTDSPPHTEHTSTKERAFWTFTEWPTCLVKNHTFTKCEMTSNRNN